MLEKDIPQAVRSFWEKFLGTVAYDATARLYEVFFFADTEPVANELAELVLSGTKRGTAGLLWAYEAEKQAIPKSGNLSIMTNWSGEPLCVIETEQVTIVPFEEVSEDFATIEGEGDKSLSYWREAHWSFFSRECARIGKQPNLSMPIVCEQFSVIYQPQNNAA